MQFYHIVITDMFWSHLVIFRVERTRTWDIPKCHKIFEAGIQVSTFNSVQHLENL